MFILSEYILSKTQFGSNPNKLSTMSIVIGLVCYGALYFYFLAYYRDTLPFINQYLVYFIALDLIISIFYYYKQYSNSEPNLISSFFDKSQNADEEDFNALEDSEDSDKSTCTDVSFDEHENSIEDDENDTDDTDITDIQFEENFEEEMLLDQDLHAEDSLPTVTELENNTNLEEEKENQVEENMGVHSLYENPENSQNENTEEHIEQLVQEVEITSMEQQLQHTLEQLQEQESPLSHSLQQLPLTKVPKKRGRKPKNFVSI